MLETIFAFLGTIVGYGTCAILNALKDKPKQIDVKQELIYLTEQVIGCKNRLENIENKVYIEHKIINKKLENIEFHITDDGQNFEAVKVDLEYLEDKFIDIERLMCRQTNNLKNCIINKKTRRENRC